MNAKGRTYIPFYRSLDEGIQRSQGQSGEEGEVAFHMQAIS